MVLEFKEWNIQPCISATARTITEQCSKILTIKYVKYILLKIWCRISIKRLEQNLTNTLHMTICGLCEQLTPWSSLSWYINSQWSFTYSRNYLPLIEHIRSLLLSQQDANLRKTIPVHIFLSYPLI